MDAWNPFKNFLLNLRSSLRIRLQEIQDVNKWRTFYYISALQNVSFSFVCHFNTCHAESVGNDILFSFN
jgi:hypothetical protein